MKIKFDRFYSSITLKNINEKIYTKLVFTGTKSYIYILDDLFFIFIEYDCWVYPLKRLYKKISIYGKFGDIIKIFKINEGRLKL